MKSILRSGQIEYSEDSGAYVDKSILRSGQIEYSEDSGAYVDKSIERAAVKIVWVHLVVCVFVGFFAAVGICIGVVKVLNWVL